MTGWWFGFFIFPNSWDDDPIWLSYFSGMLKPPTSFKSPWTQPEIPTPCDCDTAERGERLGDDVGIAQHGHRGDPGERWEKSMDWFKGKFTGKHHVYWEKPWFPVDFPLNQSIEKIIAVIAVIAQALLILSCILLPDVWNSLWLCQNSYWKWPFNSWFTH